MNIRRVHTGKLKFSIQDISLPLSIYVRFQLLIYTKTI